MKASDVCLNKKDNPTENQVGILLWHVRWHVIANVRINASTAGITRPLLARAGTMEQLLLTVPECCRLAAIGRTKFYELVATGEIPIRKVGRKTVVAASDLRDWVERLPVARTRSAT